LTIAISAKVQAGLVLGADTATTIMARGQQAQKVYYNARKLFPLHDRLPIGALTWGLGSIGDYSIAHVAKTLRGRFSDPADTEFHLADESYTLREVAERTRHFVFEIVYKRVLGRSRRSRPALGLLVAGYSAGAELAEEWEIVIDEHGDCLPPRCLRRENEYGIIARGQPEAVNLLLNAYSEDVFEPIAKRAGVSRAKIDSMLNVYAGLREQRLPAPPYMPIRDAIELVAFLVSTEMGYRRFLPYEAAATVGGHVEVAAITRFEGFQWVNRADDFAPPKYVP
jgi:hypothetical protein